MFASAACGDNENNGDSESRVTEKSDVVISKADDESDTVNSESDNKNGAVSNAKGYETAFENYIEVFYNGNSDKLCDVAPEEYWDYARKDSGLSYDEMVAEFEDYYSMFIDEYVSEYGEGYDTSYKVISAKELNKNALMEYTKDIEEVYGISTNRVKVMYEVEVNFVIDGDIDDNDTMYVIQFGEDWYLFEEDGYLYFD